MTQTERVLELLRARGDRGLTALEALESGAGMRLAARIADLKAAGNRIKVETITTKNGARVAKYVLEVPQKRRTWDEMRDEMLSR